MPPRPAAGLVAVALARGENRPSFDPLALTDLDAAIAPAVEEQHAAFRKRQAAELPEPGPEQDARQRQAEMLFNTNLPPVNASRSSRENVKRREH